MYAPLSKMCETDFSLPIIDQRAMCDTFHAKDYNDCETHLGARLTRGHSHVNIPGK